MLSKSPGPGSVAYCLGPPSQVPIKPPGSLVISVLSPDPVGSGIFPGSGSGYTFGSGSGKNNQIVFFFIALFVQKCRWIVSLKVIQVG